MSDLRVSLDHSNRVTDWTDRQLLEAYNRSSKTSEACEAFTELVRRHEVMIFTSALRVTGSRADAQDVLQATLLKLANREGRMLRVERLSGWLHTVATREAIKMKQRDQKRREREQRAILQERKKENSATLQILDESLTHLKVKDREVLVQHYLEGKTYKEIAQLLGGTDGAWQKRGERALDKLAAIMKRRNIATTGPVLGVMLLATPSEGASSEVLKHVTTTALASRGEINLSIGFVLSTMKSGIIIAATSGIILSATYGVLTDKHFLPELTTGAPIDNTSSKSHHRTQKKNYSASEVTLNMVQQAIAAVDDVAEVELYDQRKLNSLMFMLPTELLEPTLNELSKVRHDSRFHNIVSSLFARWAELNPEEAFVKSQELSRFVYHARHGAVITWLAVDFDTAIRELTKTKAKNDIKYIKELIRMVGDSDPIDTALAIDRLAEVWPEIDEEIFKLHAEQWARQSPMEAAQWIASYHDQQVADAQLSKIAHKVAMGKGLEGLKITDFIQDSTTREDARNSALYWWGISTGGYAFFPDAPETTNLTAGIPSNWTQANVENFARGLMSNYKDKRHDLLNLTMTNEQLLGAKVGLIEGSIHSSPHSTSDIVSTLPDEVLQIDRYKTFFKRYYEQWLNTNPSQAREWLEKQQQGALKNFFQSIEK